MLVIAGGHAYVVDINQRKLARTFGGYITGVLMLPEADVMILNCGTRLEAYDANASVLRWQTSRISWDGIEELRLEKDRLIGFAFDPRRVPFEVDPRTGEVAGGAYVLPGCADERADPDSG